METIVENKAQENEEKLQQEQANAAQAENAAQAAEEKVTEQKGAIEEVGLEEYKTVEAEKRESAVESQEPEKEFTTGDEVIDALLKIKKEKNIPITKDFLKRYFDDHSGLDTKKPNDVKQLIAKALKLKGYDDEEISVELESEFPNLFGDEIDPDSDLYKKELIRAGIKAKNAKQILDAEREKIYLPEGNAHTKQEILASLQKETESRFADRKKQLAYIANKTIENYSKEVFTVGDSKIEIEINDDTKSLIKDTVENFDNFFANNFVTSDGKVNVAKMRKFALFVHAESDVLSAVRGQSISEGKEELLKSDFKNVKLKKENSPTPEQGDRYTRMAKALLSN
jgi:hypothetical protein